MIVVFAIVMIMYDGCEIMRMRMMDGDDDEDDEDGDDNDDNDHNDDDDILTCI